jgi:hypothetical protein
VEKRLSVVATVEKTSLHLPVIVAQLSLSSIPYCSSHLLCGLFAVKVVRAETKNSYVMCCIMARVCAWDGLTNTNGLCMQASYCNGSDKATCLPTVLFVSI